MVQPNVPARGSEAAEIAVRPGAAPAAPVAGARPAGGPGAAGDVVEVGNRLETARALVDASPAVRGDLVAQLRARIDAGTYPIDPKEVADAIVRLAEQQFKR